MHASNASSSTTEKKLILEPTKDPFGFLIFTYCTTDELDLGSVQIASNRRRNRAHSGWNF